MHSAIKHAYDHIWIYSNSYGIQMDFAPDTRVDTMLKEGSEKVIILIQFIVVACTQFYVVSVFMWHLSKYDEHRLRPVTHKIQSHISINLGFHSIST